MRRAPMLDRNQPEIVAALRKAGAQVFSLAGAADGIPDLLVAYRGLTFLMEVKDGLKSPSKRQLTDDQISFHAGWKGGPLFIVNSIGEALDVIGVQA